MPQPKIIFSSEGTGSATAPAVLTPKLQYRILSHFVRAEVQEWRMLDAHSIAEALAPIAQTFHTRTASPVNVEHIVRIARRLRTKGQLPAYVVKKPEVAERLKVIIREARILAANGEGIVIIHLVKKHGNEIVDRAVVTTALERVGLIELRPPNPSTKIGKTFAVLTGEAGNSLLQLSLEEITARLKEDFQLDVSFSTLEEALRHLPEDQAELFAKNVSKRKVARFAKTLENPLAATLFFQHASTQPIIAEVLRRLEENQPPIATQKKLIEALRPVYGMKASKVTEDVGQLLSTVSAQICFDRSISAVARLAGLDAAEFESFRSSAQKTVRIVAYTELRLGRTALGVLIDEPLQDRRTRSARESRMAFARRQDHFANLIDLTAILPPVAFDDVVASLQADIDFAFREEPVATRGAFRCAINEITAYQISALGNPLTSTEREVLNLIADPMSAFRNAVDEMVVIARHEHFVANFVDFTAISQSLAFDDVIAALHAHIDFDAKKEQAVEIDYYVSAIHQAEMIKRLMQMRMESTDFIERNKNGLGAVVSDGNDDKAASDSEAATVARDLAMHNKKLNLIDAAFKRIEAGVYGICVDTDEEIEISRLRANPLALRTIEAQERFERRASLCDMDKQGVIIGVPRIR